MHLICLRYYREDLIMGAEGLLLNVGTKRSLDPTPYPRNPISRDLYLSSRV